MCVLSDWKYKINTHHVSREIIEKVKNTNKEQEALQREQADLKENQVTRPEIKNILTGSLKLLERLSSSLTSDVEENVNWNQEK